MARAIADSDDDEEEIYTELDDVDARANGAGQGGNAAHGEAAMNGSNERSTGSTEQLRRQLLSAERGLVSNSAPTTAVNAQASSTGSPSVHANKRRHSTTLGADAISSPLKSVKRAKTSLKTYGGRRQSRIPDDEDELVGLKDEAAAPRTSQSARFTEHSGVGSSSGLPAGSLEADFANHEPAVMFRDSGSTVADTSSEQQRMLQKALRGEKTFNSSALRVAQSSEQHSSSIPWTPSQQMNFAKSNGKQRVEDLGRKDDMPEEPAGPNAHRNDQPHGERNRPVAGDEFTGDESASVADPCHPQLSPAVEIPRPSAVASSPSRENPTSTSKPARGRKRKKEENESSEPLNSEDLAIGLPKERYKPRPSRRRATQIDEEPIDYSIRPEKAAKVKRNKTAESRDATTQADPDLVHEIIANLGKNPKWQEQQGGTPKVPATIGDHSVEKDPRKTGEVMMQPENDQQQSSQKPDHPMSSAQQEPDDEIFVRPVIPTPKPKSKAKAKRAHTTIFEDNVGFSGSQRSPTLRQQQSARLSALQDVQNEASSKKRKRNVDADEEDDDEDELATITHDDEDSQPKKRGRGRPPKIAAKPQAKSAGKVLEDSESEDEEEEEEEVSEAEKAPKKRGRRRLSKAAAQSQPTAKMQTEPDDLHGDAKPPDDVPESTPTGRPELRENGTEGPGSSQGNESATKAAMPTPEKPSADTAAKKESKPSPTTHSPIKSSSKVPFRVGLSKRHRIPSLLRVMKPPKQ